MRLCGRYLWRWLGLTGALILWFVPWKTVATLTLTLEDQRGLPVTRHAEANFLDANGNVITIVRLDDGLPSWGSTLHWWSHSSHAQSRLKPRDAKRAVHATVRAAGCMTQTVPVMMQRHYEPTSLSPHGNGLAHWYYEFKTTVRLDCRPE